MLFSVVRRAITRIDVTRECLLSFLQLLLLHKNNEKKMKEKEDDQWKWIVKMDLNRHIYISIVYL